MAESALSGLQNSGAPVKVRAQHASRTRVNQLEVLKPVSAEPAACEGREPDVFGSGQGWEEPRQDLAGGGGLSEFRDVHDAWRFCATMQMRTPLRVLARHGEKYSNRVAAPPAIADEPWQGIWVPVSKTFRELGLDIDEPASGTMASHIGPIPADGGTFLPFLKSVRAIVESDGAVSERRKRLNTSLADPAVASMVRKLGGRAAILDQLFPTFLSTIPGLPAKAIAGLQARRLTSAKAISSAADAELLAVPGIGQTKLVVLRARSEAAGRSSEIYLDSPSR